MKGILNALSGRLCGGQLLEWLRDFIELSPGQFDSQGES